MTAGRRASLRSAVRDEPDDERDDGGDHDGDGAPIGGRPHGPIAGLARIAGGREIAEVLRQIFSAGDFEIERSLTFGTRRVAPRASRAWACLAPSSRPPGLVGRGAVIRDRGRAGGGGRGRRPHRLALGGRRHRAGANLADATGAVAAVAARGGGAVGCLGRDGVGGGSVEPLAGPGSAAASSCHVGAPPGLAAAPSTCARVAPSSCSRSSTPRRCQVTNGRSWGFPRRCRDRRRRSRSSRHRSTAVGTWRS